MKGTIVMNTVDAAGTSASTRARATLLAGAGLLALVLAPVANAQDQAQPASDQALPAADAPDADGASSGNEIIVTATKREQTLQSVPVAVTVTTAETIERAQIRDIKDLTSVVPSLRVTQLQSSANTNFIIRGFGNGANNAGIEPSVGLFVDGVYRSRSASMISDLPDVQRIEVLRGPQSTLFGKNASVGVISIVTQKPQFNWGGNVEASYGNYNAIVGKGVVTGPISDQLAFSLAGGYNKRDGYADDLGTGHKSNERNRWFARGQLLWEPQSALRVRLIGDYSHIDENCCGVINLVPSASTLAIRALGGNVNAVDERFADKVYSNFDSTNKIKNFGLSGQIDYDLGPFTLTSITAWRGVDAKTNQDSDFTSADLLGVNAQDQKIRTFTQELRVATNMEGPLNFLAGAYYFNEKIDQANNVGWGAAARPYASLLINQLSGGTQTVSTLEQTIGAGIGRDLTGAFFARGQGLNEQYRLKDDAWSVFGQADFKVTDRLTITGGINYTRDTKRYSANAQSSDTFANLDFVAIGGALVSRGVIAQTLGTTDPAAIAAFAQANPATFAAISAQANAIGALNANITPAAAAADSNPLTVGNPLLGLKALQYFPPFLGVPNSVEPGRTSDGKLTWVARIAYDVTDKINLYASYATGFKASSINLSRDSRPFDSDRTALEAGGLARVNQTYGTRYANPENSKVYEVGLKADWGVATANVAVFQQSITGFQSNVFTGKGFVLANAGKETVRGIEFEGNVKPIKGLTFSAAFTYLDAKYDSFLLSAVGDLSGRQPAGIPELSTTLGFSWDQEIAHSGHHLILRGDYHYESPNQLEEGLPGFLDLGTQAAIDAAAPFRAEVSELNASITWVMPNGLELTAWGRNITNDRWLLNIFDSPAQPHSVSGYTSQPRTWGGSVRYRF
jgi:outer membrane receptor protein involved in Fe transport